MKVIRTILQFGGFLIAAQGLVLGLFAAALGQSTMPELLYSEIIFVQGIELGAGGRAEALGGAYRALSDDLSGLYWNPAGLASVRRIEFALGLSQGWIEDKARITSPPISNQLSRTRLNQVGLVFPVPTYRGSLVFALAYHQVHNFDSFGTFRDTNSDRFFQADELETGRLGLWSLGIAIDVSQKVSTGLSLQLWTGFDDYSYASVADSVNDNWYRFEQARNSDLSGFNLLGGLLVRPLPWLRLGATLESPLKLAIARDYSERIDSSLAGQYGYDTFSTSHEFHVSRSFRTALGAAVLIKRFGISSDIVLNDWSQISYRDEPPLIGFTRDEANREITRYLRPTLDFHLGLEYWLPFLDARLQAGYAYLSTPFENTMTLGNKQVFSGGFGILLDPSLHLQTSASLSQWDRSIGGWDENLKLTHLLVTLSYRF